MTNHLSRNTPLLADSAAPTAPGEHHAACGRGGEERCAREAHALAEIVQRINQSLELDRVFALIADYATELLQARGSRLGMLDGESLVIAAASGLARLQVGDRMPLDSTICGSCIRTRSPARTSDLASSPGRWTWNSSQATLGCRNAVAAPLLVGDRAIGALIVFSDEEHDFDQHDGELLMALANHAAIAIENARLYRASVRTTQHASILASSARSLALNVAPQGMYADIARIAGASLGANGISIYLADPSTRAVELVYSAGVGAATAAEPIVPTFWETAGGRVVQSGVAEFRPDIREFADEAVTRSLLEQRVASVAVVPLMIEGRPRGLLALRFHARQAFDPEQRNLLTDFGAHAAVALRNALLFEALEQRATRLAAVAQVQQAISAAVSLGEVYAEIYKAVASVVDAPRFALFSFDEDDGVFVPEYVVNDGSPVDPSSLPRFGLNEGTTSRAFRSGTPNVTARSARGWTGQTHELDGSGSIAAVLSAPIVYGEQVLGVLQAQSYRHDAYKWGDVDIVMLVARQAGTAIAKARMYEAERRAREEAEASAAIARMALHAASVDSGARDLLAIVNGVVPCSVAALVVVRGGRELRYVAAHGDMPGAPGGVVPLLSRGREIGALALAEPPSASVAARQHATLARLAAPVALALDSMLMREEERRQQAKERTLAAALEAMEQPVFICSAEAVIQYANGAATREYGYGPEEFLGMHERRLSIRPGGQRTTEEMRQSARTRGAWAGELLQRRKDGSEFPAWVTLSAIRGGDGGEMGAVVIVRNLTEERRMAEQLRQAEKLVAIGELVAGVAHEVNNPLTGVSAFAQLLLEDKLTAEQLEAVSLIKREADRAGAVVRDLLTFARKTGPRNVSIDVNELIEQTLRLRTYGLRTAGVEVALALAPHVQRVRGDDRQLQQVLLNLVVNAEHAMATMSERTLTVRTANEADRVVIEIGDSGAGMSPEVQRRIFEPFFTTKPEGKGTGLGLSVSYGIVQTHGGTLTVHSAPGAGTTFRLSLPSERGDAATRQARAD